MPRVSVLMPVFNTAAYVHEAVRSICEQQFSDFEFIIIDDGSVDGSAEILRSFAESDQRIELTLRPNRGLVATRNELLETARGELIAWMDSDDLCSPDRLSRQVELLDAEQHIACVGTNVRLIDPDGFGLGFEEYPSDDAGIRLAQQSGGGLRFASTMVRTSVAQSIGGFRAPFRMGEDFDFLLRVGERGDFANIEKPLYIYRQHLLSTCSAIGGNWPEYKSIILQLAAERRGGGLDRLARGEVLEFPSADQFSARRFKPAVLLDWAERAAKEGDRARALRYTAAALGCAPLRRASWRGLAKLALHRW